MEDDPRGFGVKVNNLNQNLLFPNLQTRHVGVERTCAIASEAEGDSKVAGDPRSFIRVAQHSFQ